MRTAPKQNGQIDRLDEGDWLNRLLADIHQEIARQPAPSAVERIRGRLLAQMKEPTRAAA